MYTNEFDLKSIAESVFFALDLDYVVIDVAEVPEACGWKVTFFDPTRASGRSIVDVLVVPHATRASEDDLKNEFKLELTRCLGRPLSYCGPSRNA